MTSRQDIPLRPSPPPSPFFGLCETAAQKKSEAPHPDRSEFAPRSNSQAKTTRPNAARRRFFFVCVGGGERIGAAARPSPPLGPVDALGRLSRRLTQIGVSTHGRPNRSKKAAAEKPRRRKNDPKSFAPAYERSLQPTLSKRIVKAASSSHTTVKKPNAK